MRYHATDETELLHELRYLNWREASREIEAFIWRKVFSAQPEDGELLVDHFGDSLQPILALGAFYAWPSSAPEGFADDLEQRAVNDARDILRKWYTQEHDRLMALYDKTREAA